VGPRRASRETETGRRERAARGRSSRVEKLPENEVAVRVVKAVFLGVVAVLMVIKIRAVY